jgi:endonuclease/exonuclease/phosphatase (EEP) superfamily protein YafD
MKLPVTRNEAPGLARSLAPLLWLLVLGFAAAHLFALLAKLSPFFELFTHFAAQYLAVGIALAGLALLMRRYVAFALALGLGLSNLYLLWPYVFGPPPMVLSEGPPLRLVSANLNNLNADAQAVQAFLQASEADIIVLTELVAQLDPAFAAAQPRFPHLLRTKGTRHHPFGLAIFSRAPLRDPVVHLPAGVDFPVVEFRHCPEPAPCVAIIALHAVRPRELENLRDQLLGFAFERARLAGVAREQAIVVGDLNITPFSPVFARFQALGLRDAGLGQGWQPTWPASLGFAGIPIDHVLVSPQIAVKAYSRLPAMGSDHFPIAVELRLPAKPLR